MDFVSLGVDTVHLRERDPVGKFKGFDTTMKQKEESHG